MNPSQTQLAEARRALEAGDIAEARRQLRLVVNQDPNNYRAWLWLAGITDSPAASLQYAKRAYSLRPSDGAVMEALTWAQKRMTDSQIRQARPRPLISASPPVRSQPRMATGTPAQPVRDTQTRLPVRDSSVRTAPVRAEPPPAPSVGAPPAAPRPAFDWKTIAIILLFITVLLLAWQIARSMTGGIGSAPEATGPNVVLNETGATAAGVVAGSDSAETAPIAYETGSGAAGLLPKLIIPAVNAAVVATWTPTPMPTPMPTATPAPPEPTVAPETLAGSGEPRWINVDLGNQVLTAYEFATPVYTTYITSGQWNTPTVTGQFRIYQRFDQQDMSGYHLGYDYYLPNVPHVMYFYGDYALHGAYWRDVFGSPGSHGCINLPLPAAEWLYAFADVGTLVNIHY